MDVPHVLGRVLLSVRAGDVGLGGLSGASLGGRRAGLEGTSGWLSVAPVCGGGAPVPVAGGEGLLGVCGGVLFWGAAARLRGSHLPRWGMAFPRSVCGLCAGGEGEWASPLFLVGLGSLPFGPHGVGPSSDPPVGSGVRPACSPPAPPAPGSLSGPPRGLPPAPSLRGGGSFPGGGRFGGWVSFSWDGRVSFLSASLRLTD